MYFFVSIIDFKLILDIVFKYFNGYYIFKTKINTKFVDIYKIYIEIFIY